MAQNIFFQLSIVIFIALLVSIIMRLIRQPLIIGYIFTGIIAGPFALNLVQSSEILSAFSQIGVAFLLFIVGLNLNFRALREVGFASLIAGTGQIMLTFIIGYSVCSLMGLSSISSL